MTWRKTLFPLKDMQVGATLENRLLPPVRNSSPYPSKTLRVYMVPESSFFSLQGSLFCPSDSLSLSFTTLCRRDSLHTDLFCHPLCLSFSFLWENDCWTQRHLKISRSLHRILHSLPWLTMTTTPGTREESCRESVKECEKWKGHRESKERRTHEEKCVCLKSYRWIKEKRGKKRTQRNFYLFQ